MCCNCRIFKLFRIFPNKLRNKRQKSGQFLLKMRNTLFKRLFSDSWQPVDVVGVPRRNRSIVWHQKVANGTERKPNPLDIVCRHFHWNPKKKETIPVFAVTKRSVPGILTRHAYPEWPLSWKHYHTSGNFFNFLNFFYRFLIIFYKIKIVTNELDFSSNPSSTPSF